MRGGTLALAAFLLAASGAAQTPEATPTPTPGRPPIAAAPQADAPAPEAGPSPAPSTQTESAPAAPEAAVEPPPEAAAEPELAPGEISIRADVQEGDDEHFQARGSVDLQAGSLRVLADTLDMYSTEEAPGVRSRKIVAEGNVVFIREEERLAGSRLTMDLDKSTGVFENAIGYLEPGVFIEGKTIERVDAHTYRVTGGKFTSCSQPNPRWSFTASSATVKMNDRVVAKNVIFKVKRVPALYLPYFYYPIREDQRSSGLLFPHFGYSSQRGFNIGSGLFWAMGRSFDQTLYLDRYSRFGYGLGHEFRYASREGSGTFRSYAFRMDPAVRPPDGRVWDYDIDWASSQSFVGGLRSTVSARLFSDIQFQQRHQDSLNLASTRRRRAVFSLQRSFGSTRVDLLADTNETIFPGSPTTNPDDGTTVATETRVVNRHLPSVSVRRSPGRLGDTGIVFSFEAMAERLVRGNLAETVCVSRTDPAVPCPPAEALVEPGELDRLSRFDVSPGLRRPFATSFLQFTPRLALRYTRYGSTLDDEDGVTGPSLGRGFLESGVELRGPSVSRVFHNPGGFYAERFKHVVGPEADWSYRTRVDDFDLIPKFDSIDYFVGTHQIRYGLVNQLLAKRPDRRGELTTQEVLSWRVYQTYYVQIADNQNDYDPNYSASAFGPGGVPSHYSPIQSRLRFTPTRGYSTDFRFEYNASFRQLRNLSLATTATYPRVGFQANWTRNWRLSEVAEERVVRNDTLRGSLSLDLLPGRLKVDGDADYDILRKEMMNTRARLRYDVQCCGFVVERLQYNYNQRVDTEYRFAIELANIGSVGNFLGEEGEQAGGRRSRRGLD